MRGKNSLFSGSSYELQFSPPSSGLSATFSPLQAVDLVHFTNPKRQRGKQVTSALPREVFASLALRFSIKSAAYLPGGEGTWKTLTLKVPLCGPREV